MIELAIMKKIKAVQQLIASGNREGAVVVIDEIALWYAQKKHFMSVEENLEFIGGIANLYSQVGETDKEIPFWEELCKLAESDLSRLGLMASDEDILRTGFDFLRLGRAYRKQGRIFNSKRAFERAATIVSELEIKIDVQQLLTCDDSVFVGEYNGHRLFVA